MRLVNLAEQPVELAAEVFILGDQPTAVGPGGTPRLTVQAAAPAQMPILGPRCSDLRGIGFTSPLVGFVLALQVCGAAGALIRRAVRARDRAARFEAAPFLVSGDQPAT